VAAVLVPLIVPLIQPMAGLTFWEAFSMILAKVLPLLMLPCFCAWLVRYLMPEVHRKLLEWQDLPFNLWVVALVLAIAVTTKAIVNSEMNWVLLGAMSMVSLLCCIFQFWAGRYVGSCYKPRRPRPSSQQAEERGREVRKVTAGQSLGQKNTVFAIWLGYTFMTPETAIVGGLYSIWHNFYNSWQLYRAGK
jgi:BASS family bile acid:Na+ symporter